MKNIKLFVLTLLAIVTLATPSMAQGANLATNTVTLAWNASPSESVTNYTVYIGTASGVYTGTVLAGTNLTCTVSNLLPGVLYYFTATAEDQWVKSDYCNEISCLIPRSKPIPPSQIRRK